MKPRRIGVLEDDSRRIGPFMCISMEVHSFGEALPNSTCAYIYSRQQELRSIIASGGGDSARGGGTTAAATAPAPTVAVVAPASNYNFYYH